MAQIHATAIASDNPLNREGRCLLSLDGGGVRGLSTLLIIKALMAKVNAERIKDGLPIVKPCELFDLIGGTSTGGIIAIMLGRLEMDVDECIDVYTNMFEKIFGKKGLPLNRRASIKGRFDSKVLEECITKILKDRGLSEKEPLNDGKERCKVAVCAKAFELTTTVLLRSYNSDDALNNIPATICEAVRATSAATSFFDPVTIGPRKRKFVDGGLGANNPVEQLWNEAQNIWCRDGDVELGTLLKCFVSVGTGNPGTKPIAEGPLKFFSDTLVDIVTQTEDTAKIFVQRHRKLYEGKRYFRFNFQQGLQGVGLEEYKAAPLVEAATADYMDNQEIRSAAQECAVNLKQKHYRLFSSSPRNRSAAIWGLGGCGKTQIALEYAYRCQAKTLCSIFWVHADSEASFSQDYSDLARIAGVSLDLKGEDLLGAVKQWIENQRNWLLILDNADDLTIFKKPYSASEDHQLLGPELLRFVPKSQTGTVIWTSRDGGICGNIVDVQRGIEVTVMTIEQARDLFRKLTGRSELMLSEDEDMLLELLQYLPLAIAQAAAYIRKTKVSIKQYLTFLHESESRQLDLLSQEFQDVYRSGVPNSVMRTWLISMKQISKESSCSEKILNTITFFDHKGIPFELIKEAAGPTYSEDEILLAASRLTEYSFLQTQRAVDEGLPTYEQHRLVHLATRRTLSEAQICSLSGEALRIMANLFPDGTYETWKSCIVYLPHALKASIWRNAEEYNYQAPELLRNIGFYYWEQGHSDKAEQLEIEVLELRKEILGTKHPDTITAMENLEIMNQRYISDIEELRSNNISSTSLNNLDSTQQGKSPKKFHRQLKKWTRKVIRLRRPKD
ncbi:Acyl transferase acyl hydrolase lysophospholipase protein [Rutstroemia sp. NJR-2017a BBW]|nr:Acyl transferase acyl hydrolase lysophospholipase protein [Rutstroemia sp. NJR-2017a BBW]